MAAPQSAFARSFVSAAWFKRGAASLVCLSLTACSTVATVGVHDNPAARDPFLAAEKHQPDETKRAAEVQLASAVEELDQPQDSQVVHTAAEMVEAEREVVFAGVDASAITFDPARPRHREEGLSIASVQPLPLPPPASVVGTTDVRKMELDHVDEYLVDGGDRGYPIHYHGPEVAGVESEDTFAEFEQLDGSRHVTPSNTVAVYAPRFGSLRTVTGTETGETVERLSATRDVVRDSGIHNRIVPVQERQADEPSGLTMRSRASGMRSRNQPADLAHTARATQHELLLNAYEDSLFVTAGRVDQADEAWLAKGMQAAEMWVDTERAFLIAADERGQEVYQAVRVAELSALEKDGLPGRIRLLKLADKRTAHIGDEVTFSLRYDNLGDQPVGEVRIVDHLTPRLEILEDSIMWGTDDAPLGRWEIADHEDGGTVLIFVLNGPLEGNQGGVITFSCRVK